uniref:LPXTG cell wall anchor domain-containing protein n=1 Tax=Bacillus sp. JCM 19034 TaxID=1481928 RepID=UPI000AE9D482
EGTKKDNNNEDGTEEDNNVGEGTEEDSNNDKKTGNSNEQGDLNGDRKLPRTATSMFSYLLTGMVLTVFGGILFIGYRRKSSLTSN